MGPRASARSVTNLLTCLLTCLFIIVHLRTAQAQTNCAAVAAPEHGQIGECSGVLVHGSSCTLQCDAGYSLGRVTCNEGVIEPICSDDDTFTDASGYSCTDVSRGNAEQYSPRLMRFAR